MSVLSAPGITQGLVKTLKLAICSQPGPRVWPRQRISKAPQLRTTLCLMSWLSWHARLAAGGELRGFGARAQQPLAWEGQLFRCKCRCCVRRNWENRGPQGDGKWGAMRGPRIYGLKCGGDTRVFAFPIPRTPDLHLCSAVSQKGAEPYP